MSLRVSDTNAERAVASFLDRYFYPIHARNVRRMNDRDTQMRGIDVKFDYAGNVDLLVDEKTAAHYVNKNIPTFAFELNFYTSANQLVEGWFFDENKDTQFYLLSWIRARRDFGFSVDDITELDIIIIERNRIIQMLNAYGLSRANALSKANEIRNSGIDGVHEKNNYLPYYFFNTTRLTERPVNVIIRKSKLIELSIGTHIVRPA